MNEKSTLYWSAFKEYEECPQKFLWNRGWDGIDVGGGVGKPKPLPPDQKPRHHAVMGTVIQFAIEQMYNEELYKDPNSLTDKLLDYVDAKWLREEAKPNNFMDYRQTELTRSEMLQHCKDAVINYLKTMKAHKLLGPYAKAEVGLLGWVDQETKVGGQADLIVRRDDNGVTIIDGKNSKKKTSPDPDQLRWYAMLFKVSYGELPNRVGLVWYRYPYDEDTGETGIEWIPFSEENIQDLASRVVIAHSAMKQKKFEPDPVPAKCRYCSYESVCEERQEQRSINSSKRKPRKPKETGLPVINTDSGFDFFDL